MVQGVDHQRLLTSDLLQQRTGRNIHRVRGIVLRLFLTVCKGFAFIFAGNVLIDVTAQGDVHHLKTAAHAQNGHVFAVDEQLGQGQLVSVAHGADGSAAGLLILAEQQGIHICAAGEQHAVQLVQIGVQQRVIAGQGEHHGQRVAGAECLHKIAAQHVEFLLIVQSGGNADQRTV